MRYPVTVLLYLLLLAPATLRAMGDDDPVLSWLKVDQLEQRQDGGEREQAWEIHGWVGRDLHKLWMKSEGEREHGATEAAELQLLYSRAIAPYWDMQAGWRREFLPKDERDWLAVGVHGLAPYWFEIDASLFIGESGRTAARIEAEYEVLFTQKLALVPEVELNLHGEDDPDRGIGSGLSEAELGLRLRYSLTRKFAPYIGIHYGRLFGDTADLARMDGEATEATQWLAGIQFWF